MIKMRIVLIEEGALTACSNHLAIATSRLLAVGKLFRRNLLEQYVVSDANKRFKFELDRKLNP